MALYDSILDTIGHTPVVRLHRLAPAHVQLYAKVESSARRTMPWPRSAAGVRITFAP